MTSASSNIASLPPAARREAVDACPICDSSHRTLLFQAREWLFGLEGEFPVVRCQGCTAGYLAERPEAEALAAYYPEEHYYSFHEPAPYDLFRRRDSTARLWYGVKRSVLAGQYGYRHLGGSRRLGLLLPRWGSVHRRATFNLEVLLHRFVPDGVLLEVGCGAGTYLDLMRALGWSRVVGVDLSATAIRNARDVLALEAYRCQLEEANLPPSTFDAVSLSHTLEHLPNPVRTLGEIHRLLKPGGRLAVIVPNFESLGFRVFGQAWFPLDAPRHLVNFTEQSLRAATTKAGFRIEGLRSTPRAAHAIGLFSRSRAAGDPREVHTNDQHPFPLHRRLQAVAFAVREAALVMAGQPAGEELLLVAVKDS